VESSANKDKGLTDSEITPLEIAAQNGHPEVVRFLAEFRAYLEVEQLLVASGCSSSSKKTKVRQIWGQTDESLLDTF